MRTRTLTCLLALGLLASVGAVAAHYPRFRRTPTTQVVAAAPDPTEAVNDMQVKTGDSFWGLHLDGVVPCSSMLVKGGGHLVIISRKNDHEAKCYFHVKEAKVVELGQARFRLEVVSPDHVHVTRQMLEPVALASRGGV